MVARNLQKALQHIRGDYDSIWERIYLSDAMDPFYNVVKWFRVQFQTLERMLFWGWKMRHSYDFDAHTAYDLLHLKLSRCYDCFLNHSTLVWNSSPDTKLMRRLCEAKFLAKKLSEDDYIRHSSLVREKYSRGSIDKWMRRDYPNTEAIPTKLYHHFLKKAYEADKKEKDTDKRRLYSLLEKYIEHWWD